MIVPNRCIPLLREHRTHYQGDFVKSYIADLEATFESIRPFLPATANVLDIGCGMGGIDILLNRHFEGDAKITLLDKNGLSTVVNAGFHESADTFSHYHSFDCALEMMQLNGVDNVKTIDILQQKFPTGKFSIVISLLSWGFHYPISTYQPKVKPGGIIIADIRKGTNGIEQLSKYGDVKIVHEAKKFNRVIVQC